MASPVQTEAGVWFRLLPDVARNVDDQGDCVTVRVRFDQGTVGHDYCKPTTLLTDVEEMNQLDGQRVAQGMTQGWPGYLKDRMNEAKMAAEWAPGLCDLIKTAIRRKWGQSRWRSTPGSQRRGALPQMARGPARAAALGNGLKQDEKAAAATIMQVTYPSVEIVPCAWKQTEEGRPTSVSIHVVVGPHGSVCGEP